MAAIAHNKEFAKKVGIPQSVGKDFNKADKGRKFKEGGVMAKSDMKEDMKMDKSQDKKMIKSAIKQHDDQLHGGKKTSLKLNKGGKVCMARGGGIETKGKTKGKFITMKGC
jgi:hypothetical protein